ncbi:MAG: GNAT family N-acetyltransferase [Calditrichaeota bacterium]|nr:GNAT family N-acetyltransferase [Calditrichota bacterium]
MREILRPARNHREWLEALDLWDLVFKNTPRDYFERRLLFDPHVEYKHTQLLWADGVLASSVQVTPRKMVVNGREIPFGGIANVATHPDFRKRGYSSRVLKQAIEKMKAWSLPLSLLFTDINPFYERVGFVTLEREAFTAEIQTRPRMNEEIRVFDYYRDLEPVKEIYRHFSSGWNGPMVRDDVYWKSHFSIVNEDPRFFLVRIKNHSVQAYVRASVGNDIVDIHEFGASEKAPEALDIFAQELLIRANRPKVRVNAPFGAWFEEMSHFKVERKPDTESMVSILNPEYFGFSGQSQEDMVRKLFPKEKIVYWPTDSF